MTGAIKASDIAPKAYRGERGGILEDKADDLTYDLHHLLASDSHPVDLERFKKNPEGYLLETVTFAVQGTVNRLFDLSYESTNDGPLTTLPAATVTLPRAKPIPQPKPETKWEKFAKEKGIENKKRDRMVWDEESGEWRPRWGYKRAKNGIEDLPIVEVKAGGDPMVDPWTKAKKTKKEKVMKNLKQQQKNAEEGGVKGPAFGLPVDLLPGKKHTDAGAASSKKMQKGKAGGMKALEVAQLSTASLGRFDPKIAGEPTKVQKKVKKIEPVADKKALDDESKRMNSILNAVIKPKSAGSRQSHVNIDALEPERAGYARKKGRGAVKASKKKGK